MLRFAVVQISQHISYSTETTNWLFAWPFTVLIYEIFPHIEISSEIGSAVIHNINENQNTAGAEFGKMTYTIVFVSARRNF